MDIIDWTIFQLHQMLGHDKAAAVLGVDPWPFGRDVECLLCAGKTEEWKEEVERARASAGVPDDGVRAE